MGCGNSKAENIQKKNASSKENDLNYNVLMDKNIPQYFIEDSSSETNNDEDTRSDFKTDVSSSKNRNVKKAAKVRVRDELDAQIYENMKMIDKKKKQTEIIFVIGVLKGHFVFYNLAEAELEYVVKKMFYCEVEAGEYIFKQGDNASSYFILEQGSAKVIIDDEEKKILKAGSAFGEYALLYNAPRSASIKTIEKCYLWGINRSSFRKAIEEMSLKEYEENRKFINTIPFFESMTEDQKNAICGVILTHKYASNDHIVNEGDDASSFYIIKEGTVQVLKGTKEIRKLSKGDSFGEQALYINTKRGATVVAVGEVKCLALGRDTLNNILGDKIQKIIYRNIQKWAFDKSSLLQKLTNIQKQKVIDNMTIKNYKAGTVLLNKGENCNKIFIVIEGTLKKGTIPQIAAKGFSFGDNYLTKKNNAIKMDGDLIMENDGVLAFIEFFKFFSCIGGSIEDVIEQNEFSHEKTMFKGKEKNDSSHIKLENLIYIKKLGFGQFGSVFLVKNPEKNEFYALKCIAKNQILEQNLQRHLLQEKEVMEKLSFPFTMHFFRCYRDSNFIFFLIEFVKGMELFDVIRDIGILSSYDAQFYVGSLILSLEYLHMQNIIYRDIKPENIMVDNKGYMKMIDMGTAKILNNSKGPPRTFTIIGTPHYMAPEIISGKGYTFNVDLWSVGICLFEFICGYVPFAEEAEDPYDIYEEIIKSEIKFPGFLKDKKGKKIIAQLLNKVPDARLGGSFAGLKANPWFDGFDWDKLFRKELKPPYLPPLERMIKDAAIKAMEKEGKPILEEVSNEQKVQSKKKIVPKDAEWDAVYEC